LSGHRQQSKVGQTTTGTNKTEPSETSRADTKAVMACGLMGPQQMQQSEHNLLQSVLSVTLRGDL